jgi:hypothetical protein
MRGGTGVAPQQTHACSGNSKICAIPKKRDLALGIPAYFIDDESVSSKRNHDLRPLIGSERAVIDHFDRKSLIGSWPDRVEPTKVKV